MLIFKLPQLQETLFSINKWPKDHWPEFIDLKYSGNDNTQETTIEILCFAPHTLAWFEGHYPDQPILPGVVQTYWVTELSQILFPTSKFKGINALKFINMIKPGTSLKLTLKYIKDTNSVSFSYVHESDSKEIKCSTGKAVFGQ